MAHLILASSSPRRKELLSQLNVSFDVCSPEIDEAIQPNESITAYVERLAKEKARAVIKQYPNAVILAADTSLGIDNKIIGKPTSKAHAFEIWNTLSGRQHDVFSGICVVRKNVFVTRVVHTRVEFKTLTLSEMERYWLTKEPMDKAGAYAIQGIAAQWIPRIEGSYTNVVGLPLYETVELLKTIDFSLAN